MKSDIRKYHTHIIWAHSRICRLFIGCWVKLPLDLLNMKTLREHVCMLFLNPVNDVFVAAFAMPWKAALLVYFKMLAVSRSVKCGLELRGGASSCEYIFFLLCQMEEKRNLVKSSFLVELVSGWRKLRFIFLFSDVLVCTKREQHR